MTRGLRKCESIAPKMPGRTDEYDFLRAVDEPTAPTWPRGLSYPVMRRYKIAPGEAAAQRSTVKVRA